MRPDFEAIRRRCNGMMRTGVYERIYDDACMAPDGSAFVEIGTGHGAATVCIAKAIQDTGRASTLYTFDKFEGGSRKAYGDAARNREIAHAAIADFNVQDVVISIPGDIAETAVAVPDDVDIALLMLDIDGRIDRDFATFFDRLVPGATIIIDDKADRVRSRDKGSYIRVDQKHRLTHLLVESAIENGLIEHTGTVNQTWFGRKVDGASISNWSPAAIIEAYRGLVFANAEKV